MIWAPADDNGCRFGDHCPRRAIDFIKNKVIDRKILITTLTYVLLR